MLNVMLDEYYIYRIVIILYGVIPCLFVLLVFYLCITVLLATEAYLQIRRKAKE